MRFPIMGPSSLPVVRPSLTKHMQTEQLLCWSGMTNETQSIQHLVHQRRRVVLRASSAYWLNVLPFFMALKYEQLSYNNFISTLPPRITPIGRVLSSFFPSECHTIFEQTFTGPKVWKVMNSRASAEKFSGGGNGKKYRKTAKKEGTITLLSLFQRGKSNGKKIEK